VFCILNQLPFSFQNENGSWLRHAGRSEFQTVASAPDSSGSLAQGDFGTVVDLAEMSQDNTLKTRMK